jgi:hypothetical protein
VPVEAAQVDAANGVTRITLPGDNPDDLHKLLAHVRWRELRLLSVEQVRPYLEEVFLQLITERP